MANSKIRLSVVIIAVIVALMAASTVNAKPTDPLIQVWNAINNLQQQVDDLRNITIDLQNQISNIELIPGPQGIKGDTGDQGPPGISSWERVSATSGNGIDSYKSITVSCTGNKKVLGGGVTHSYRSGSLPIIYDSYPSSDNTWTASVSVEPGKYETWNMTVWAICATVS